MTFRSTLRAWFTVAGTLFSAGAAGAPMADLLAAPVAGEYLVRLEPGASPSSLEALGGAELLVPELNLYRVRPLAGVASRAATGLRAARGVRYVTPNHRVTRRNLPNDSLFSQQWSLKDSGGKADIRAEAAWDVTTGGEDPLGRKIVVAVIDGGAEIAHPEISPNLWTNSGEIAANGIDDDANGYVDDIHGWNVYNDSGVISVDDHGTHVAGIIGAKGNDNSGVTGINWSSHIMVVAGASESTAEVAKAYGYVIAQKKLFIASQGAKGANVVVTNSSFGVDYGDCNSAEYQVWNDLYDELGKYGILSVAATANLNIDVDKEGDVPTGCKSDFIIGVTNTTEEDKRYANAAFGKTHVDLGAPGTNILSTLSRGTGVLTGTSMASPHVAGAIALMHAAACQRFSDLYQKSPPQSALLVKGMLLSTVDSLSDLAGITATGGRLNLYKAAQKMYNYGCAVP